MPSLAEKLEIGNKIKTLRKMKGLSLREFAKHTGISAATQSHYEVGRNGIPYRKLRVIADFFGVAIDDLTIESEKYPPPVNQTTRRWPTKNPTTPEEIQDKLDAQRRPIEGAFFKGTGSIIMSTVTVVNFSHLPDHIMTIRVDGDAMAPTQFNPHGLYPGEFAHVDPQISPQPGDIVLAKFGSEDFRFRQIQVDGNDRYLCALAEHIKPIRAGVVDIVGVVVGSYRMRASSPVAVPQ